MYRSNPSFNILPRTNPWAFELLNIGLNKFPAPPGGKIVQMPNPPNFFVKGKFYNRDFLPLDQISAGKTWHFRFKFPTPARQRLKFPSSLTRTTIKCQWVSREMLRWRIVFNCFKLCACAWLSIKLKANHIITSRRISARLPFWSLHLLMIKKKFWFRKHETFHSPKTQLMVTFRIFIIAEKSTSSLYVTTAWRN